MRSIQKTTFCGFIALLNKVLDFGGQLADKFSSITSAWAQIGATLLQLEQPCSNWGYLVYIDLLGYN